jgi:hypothetical protein
MNTITSNTSRLMPLLKWSVAGALPCMHRTSPRAATTQQHTTPPNLRGAIQRVLIPPRHTLHRYITGVLLPPRHTLYRYITGVLLPTRHTLYRYVIACSHTATTHALCYDTRGVAQRTFMPTNDISRLNVGTWGARGGTWEARTARLPPVGLSSSPLVVRSLLRPSTQPDSLGSTYRNIRAKWRGNIHRVEGQHPHCYTAINTHNPPTPQVVALCDACATHVMHV